MSSLTAKAEGRGVWRTDPGAARQVFSSVPQLGPMPHILPGSLAGRVALRAWPVVVALGSLHFLRMMHAQGGGCRAFAFRKGFPDLTFATEAEPSERRGPGSLVRFGLTSSTWTFLSVPQEPTHSCTASICWQCKEECAGCLSDPSIYSSEPSTATRRQLHS